MPRSRALAAPGFPLVALGLAALAWMLLLGLDFTPYGRYLHHDDWTSIGLGSALCAAVPGGPLVLPVLTYAAGWLLMITAMMLPTILPLMRAFDRMVAARHDAASLHFLLLTGYLAAWSVFGVAAYVLDWALHAGLNGVVPFVRHPWIAAAMAFAIAGAFQFSSLKYRCLDRCRTPISFIASHWHGPRPLLEAFTLGLAHGAYCVGCCWAMMLLMFAIGMGNLGWMLLLGLIMAIEKNHRWGRHLSAPLGASLLAVAGLLLVAS